MNKLFREENAVKSCLTCEFFRDGEQEGTKICIKRKNTEAAEDFACRKYKYNIFSKPVHRRKSLKSGAFKSEDFSLD